MAKNQNEAGKEKKPEIKGLTTMVKTKDIMGPYPWMAGPDEDISEKMAAHLFLTAKDHIRERGIQEAIHLVRLDKAPEHVEDKEGFKPGYYALCGRNRWEIAKELGIEEMESKIVPAGSYEEMALYALASNLIRKSVTEKDDFKAEKTDEDKELRQEGVKKDNVTTASLRGAWLEFKGVDPEIGNKLKGLKHALETAKDEEKKQKIQDEISALETSAVTLKIAGESLGLSQATAFRAYYLRQALKEDAKEDGVKPRDKKYEYASWREMAKAKGVTFTVTAFLGGDNPGPGPKPVKIKVEDKETGFMASNFKEFQDKLEAAQEEHPEGMVTMNLQAKIWPNVEEIPEDVEGGISLKDVIPAAIGEQDERAEKNAEEVTPAGVRIKELEDEAEAREETLEVELNKKEALEKEVKELRAKVAAWESKPQEEKERILNAENHYADRKFTNKDVAELYGWLDQELRTAMEKFGGLVKFIDVKVEYGRKTD